MKANHTEKLDDGLVEMTTNIGSCGWLVVPLQFMNDYSTDDNVGDSRYHQCDRQQRVHVDLYSMNCCKCNDDVYSPMKAENT